MKPVRRFAWYGLSTFDAGRRQPPEHGEHARSGATAPIAARCSQRTPDEEQHGREHGRVDERRADVGLDEDERDRDRRERDRAERRPQLARSASARSARNAARKSVNSTFPNSDGWKRKKPTSIQRREPRVAAPATSTSSISPSVVAEDQPAEAPVDGRVDQRRDDEHARRRPRRTAPGAPTELAGVVARDAVDRPEPVARRARPSRRRATSRARGGRRRRRSASAGAATAGGRGHGCRLPRTPSVGRVGGRGVVAAP